MKELKKQKKFLPSFGAIWGGWKPIANWWRKKSLSLSLFLPCPKKILHGASKNEKNLNLKKLQADSKTLYLISLSPSLSVFFWKKRFYRGAGLLPILTNSIRIAPSKKTTTSSSMKCSDQRAVASNPFLCFINNFASSTCQTTLWRATGEFKNFFRPTQFLCAQACHKAQCAMSNLKQSQTSFCISVHFYKCWMQRHLYSEF
jgi:hypothetical protein